MALTGVGHSMMRDISQKRVAITDNSLVTLVAAVADSKIKVFAFFMSSASATKFTLRSGNNAIFDIHATDTWGVLALNSLSNIPLFATNEGEVLTIQQTDEDLIDANVYLQYTTE